MTSKEAFEQWWINTYGGNWSATYTISEKDKAEEGWQAACEWQKQKDAKICNGQWGARDCAEDILNQGDE